MRGCIFTLLYLWSLKVQKRCAFLVLASCHTYVRSNKRLTTGTSRLVTTFIRNGTRDQDERNDYMVIIESSTEESAYSVKRVERVESEI